ncbi:DUF2474 family protein [Fontimonas thermophila]|nr:DUF2474 family protein [Fontimonas thermophila]
MEKSSLEPATRTERARRWQQLAWFVGLWALSVGLFGAVSHVLRTLLMP